MVSVRTAALPVIAAISLALGAAPAMASCDRSPAKPLAGSPLTANVLVELNEIGFPDGAVTDAPPPMAVDPTGTRIAFLVARADVATNSYCHTLIVMDLAGGGPRVLARGGDFAPQSAAIRGNFANFGTPLVATPAWSPDGRHIAWLRRDNGVTQVWVVAVDGTGARGLTRSPVDIVDVRWDQAGRVVYATRPAMAQVRTALDREGESGWLYDARVTPNAGARPLYVASSVPIAWFAQGLDTAVGAPIAAPAEENLRSASGDRLALVKDGDDLLAEMKVEWRDAAGKVRSCSAEACRGRLADSWWQPNSATGWFLRREGFKRETSALYRWSAAGQPERMFATTDMLAWCRPATRGLVCLREGSTTPRTIVLIDWTTGKAAPVFDPNPGFGNYRLGQVNRLKWKNDRGLEAWGDLVLPPDYTPGAKLPMVVVQYTSRGFLRGGTGNEYPVFLLAQRGIAVLSLERPDGVVSKMTGLKTLPAVLRAMANGWADRYSIQSSIETGVKAAIATGKIDPARIGISGLSDGATAVRFALINSKLFAAASLSSCCVEPDTPGLSGPAFADQLRDWGAPPAGQTDDAYWKPVSLILNADLIDTPLLMQLSDDEYLIAVNAYEALRARGKPVEMFVFPDEHHNKWQPRHRFAIYNRNLDWFDFWLRGQEDSDPAKSEQYRRWERMRGKR